MIWRYSTSIFAGALGLILTGTAAYAAPEKVRFQSGSETVVGELYWHSSAPNLKNYPAVVLIGPISSLKDQIVNRYAEKLAKHGFAALNFDPRTFGESGGHPRQMEHPERKVEDVLAAVQFLSAHEHIDKDTLAVVGVCCGANVALRASVSDKRISRLAYVASCPVDAEVWRSSFGEGLLSSKYVEARAARAEFNIFKNVQYVPVTTGQWDHSFIGAITDSRAAGYFLTERNPSPTWVNQVAAMSMEDFFNFDSVKALPLLSQPTIFILADEDQKGCPQTASHITATTAVKRIVVLPRAGQMDFYDNEAVIDRAVKEIAAWFQARLIMRR